MVVVDVFVLRHALGLDLARHQRLFADGDQLRQGEVGLNGIPVDLVQPRVHQRVHGAALHLLQYGGEHAALALRALVVGVDQADAAVAGGEQAVQVQRAALGVGLGVDVVAVLLRVHGVDLLEGVVGVLVQLLQLLVLDLHVHAADGVHQIHHGAEVHDDVVRDVQLEGFVDHAHGHLRAAVGVGGVQLVLAVAGDLHQRVAQRGHQPYRIVAHGGDHHGVAALLAVLEEVHAQQQDVHPVAWQAVGEGELGISRLDVHEGRRNRIEHARRQHDGHQHERDQLQQRAQQPVGAASAALPAPFAAALSSVSVVVHRSPSARSDLRLNATSIAQLPPERNG